MAKKAMKLKDLVVVLAKVCYNAQLFVKEHKYSSMAIDITMKAVSGVCSEFIKENTELGSDVNWGIVFEELRGQKEMSEKDWRKRLTVVVENYSFDKVK